MSAKLEPLLADLARTLHDRWAGVVVPQATEYAARWTRASAALASYGLSWVLTPKTARIDIGDLRALVCDHALLSFWSVDRRREPGKPPMPVAGMDSFCYTMALIEATEVLVAELAAIEAAAEKTLSES